MTGKKENYDRIKIIKVDVSMWCQYEINSRGMEGHILGVIWLIILV